MQTKPAPTMTLTPEQVALYRRNGFVNAGQVLAGDEVEVLREEVERVLRDRIDSGKHQPYSLHNIAKTAGQEVWQIVNIWQASEAFQRLVHNPLIVAAAQQATGAAGLRLWHDQIQYKPAAIGGVNNWHQDGPYWAPVSPVDTQITAWVALDDADDDNGCMSMVPGSSRWGNAIEFLHTVKDYHNMPHEWNGHEIHVVRTPVQKGSVHLHHAYTWHGSHANRSGRPRRAIALHFMDSSVTVLKEKRLAHILGDTISSEPGQPIDGPLFMKVYPFEQAQKPSLASVSHLRWNHAR